MFTRIEDFFKNLSVWGAYIELGLLEGATMHLRLKTILPLLILISFFTRISGISVVDLDMSIRLPFHGDACDFFLTKSLLMLSQKIKF